MEYFLTANTNKVVSIQPMHRSEHPTTDVAMTGFQASKSEHCERLEHVKHASHVRVVVKAVTALQVPASRQCSTAKHSNIGWLSIERANTKEKHAASW